MYSVPEKKTKEIAEIVRNGGVTLIPTDTCYGLTAKLSGNRGIKRIFKLKKRDPAKALIVLISSLEMLERITTQRSDEFYALAEKLWPGPLSLVFEACSDVNPLVTGGGDSIAVRYPDNKFLLNLIDQVGEPISSTSANLSCQKPSYSIEEIDISVREGCDIVLDVGMLNTVMPSTVLDIRKTPFRLLREGALPVGRLEKFLNPS